MTATRLKGCEGVLKVKPVGASGAASQMFGVNSWELETTVDKEEASEIGECKKTYVPGSAETNGTVDLWYDNATGANQGLIVAGGAMDLEIYPAGTGSGKPLISSPTGGVTMETVARNGGTTGAVGSRFNFFAAGKMIETTIP